MSKTYSFNQVLRDFIFKIDHCGCEPNNVRMQGVKLLNMIHGKSYSTRYFKEEYKCNQCKCVKCSSNDE